MLVLRVHHGVESSSLRLRPLRSVRGLTRRRTMSKTQIGSLPLAPGNGLTLIRRWPVIPRGREVGSSGAQGRPERAGTSRRHDLSDAWLAGWCSSTHCFCNPDKSTFQSGRATVLPSRSEGISIHDWAHSPGPGRWHSSHPRPAAINREVRLPDGGWRPRHPTCWRLPGSHPNRRPWRA